MTNSSPDDNGLSQSENKSKSNDRGAAAQPMSDEAARHALDHGDNEKIDRALDELDVSTTKSGKDQPQKPDTEGSNSSSKNLDQQVSQD
jgi:hypothetical protein